MFYGQDYDWLSELKVSYNQKKHCTQLKQWNQDHMLMCMHAFTCVRPPLGSSAVAIVPPWGMYFVYPTTGSV